MERPSVIFHYLWYILCHDKTVKNESLIVIDVTNLMYHYG